MVSTLIFICISIVYKRENIYVCTNSHVCACVRVCVCGFFSLNQMYINLMRIHSTNQLRNTVEKAQCVHYTDKETETQGRSRGWEAAGPAWTDTGLTTGSTLSHFPTRHPSKSGALDRVQSWSWIIIPTLLATYLALNYTSFHRSLGLFPV